MKCLTSRRSLTIFLSLLLSFIPLGFVGAGGSGDKEFDPKKINVDKIQNDKEFAEAIPEYEISFTGLLDRKKEITFKEIVTVHSERVKTRRFRGVRTDGEKIESEYSGIPVSELLKNRKIREDVKNVIIYGNDKYAVRMPASAILEGKVFIVWKREGQYLVPKQDGVLKIVEDGGLTKNWVKNPVLFEFTSEFFDTVPQADRLNENEIDFIDQQSMFTLAIGTVPTIKVEDWRLKIGGLVEHPRVYTYEDLRRMPQISVYATLETISNPPGGRLIGNAIWTGIPMGYIFEQLKPKRGVLEVAFKCRDGYSTSITMEEARKEDVMLAYVMNGEPLTPEQGYPLRAVVPDKYGMKWPKWIDEIEFLDYDYKGYWENRGWSDYAGRDRPNERFE